MVPWYWFLLVVVLAALAVVAVWLVMRSRTVGSEALDAERSKVKRLEEEAAAASAAASRIADELRGFAEESKRVQAWYDEHKVKIAQEARDAFARLVTDPAELDRRLDALLNGAADPDKTPKPC